jgi:hypothetical protein
MSSGFASAVIPVYCCICQRERNKEGENEMATKTAKFKGVENKPYIEGMREIRRSNAAGSHDSRPPRQRTRSTAKRQAIKHGW